ncbi:substrate-binding domain-containing protein [Streptomyces sp. NPDC102394]|uniref:substrate-binding domain-containing protein n=1 Tax=Streptomyces sp. NPDC102394 TaxID=3366167 RepID=UPI0037F86BD5
MTEVLARHPDVDGVLAASDTTAAGALQVVCAAGRCVPHDVALIGLDDFSPALCTKPRLTTVRQSPDAMGRTMIRLLQADMEGPSVAYRRATLRIRLVHS